MIISSDLQKRNKLQFVSHTIIIFDIFSFSRNQMKVNYSLHFSQNVVSFQESSLILKCTHFQVPMVIQSCKDWTPLLLVVKNITMQELGLQSGVHLLLLISKRVVRLILLSKQICVSNLWSVYSYSYYFIFEKKLNDVLSSIIKIQS